MRILLLLLAFLSAVAAAPSGKPRTCRILFLAAPDDAPEKLNLFDGKVSQEVELPRMNLSPVYQLPAGALTIRMLPAPAGDPKQVDARAPSARIAEEITDCYLLVNPDPKNPVAPVAIQVINANPDKLRKGQMLWFNLTPNKVGGQLGSRQLAMEPNSRAVVDSPAAGNEGYQVNLSFRIPGDERLFPLCETKWTHDPASRTIFFILSHAGSRTPRVMGFPDSRVEEKPDGETAERGPTS